MKKYAVISIDVEDWYHTYYPEKEVDRSVSLLDGLDVALNIMKEKGICGSFFVVGEIVDQIESKLKTMKTEGHEIACHNYKHVRPIGMDIDTFREQLVETKKKLERVLGNTVSGYRAPSFGIDDVRLEIVRSVGFNYDSSMLKEQKSAKYGKLALDGYHEIAPCIYEKEGFTEFEVSTQRIGNINMLLGGGYIRMLPWFFMRRMIVRYLKTGKLFVLYTHPIDLSSQPTPKVNDISFDRYLRTHVGRKKMVNRFRKVIAMLEKHGYEFVTFEQLRNVI